VSGVEWVAAVLILTGVAFSLLGAVGLQQFPDVFARIHVATKPVTLGIASLLIGAALVMPEPRASAKLLLVGALQFITAPVAAHMVGRAAYRSGRELSPQTAVDELADVGVGEPGGEW
jgi:multicomponent Na+:H+ antiporter subunit G